MAENGRMKGKRYKPPRRSPMSTEDALHQHLLLIVMTFLLID